MGWEYLEGTGELRHTNPDKKVSNQFGFSVVLVSLDAHEHLALGCCQATAPDCIRWVNANGRQSLGEVGRGGTG